MTTTWASPADTPTLVISSERHWCADCAEDMIFDRPAGAGSPEACCVGCGYAVFLWVEDATWAADHEALAA